MLRLLHPLELTSSERERNMARITGPRASRGVQMTFKKVNEFTDAESWYNEFTDTESCYNESTDAESCYDVNSPADDGASSDAEMVDVGNEPATTEWQRVDKPAASKRQRVTISCAAYDSSATESEFANTTSQSLPKGNGLHLRKLYENADLLRLAAPRR